MSSCEKAFKKKEENEKNEKVSSLIPLREIAYVKWNTVEKNYKKMNQLKYVR